MGLLYLNSLIHLMQVDRFVQSYTITCSVGDGGQGQAFLAKKDDMLFVVKLYFSSPKALGYFTHQVRVLSEIDCPYIVKMVDHFAEARVYLGQHEEIRPAVVLEFAQHGQLFKIVNLGKLSEDVSRTLFFQLVTALKYLKDIKITHRDVKLQNILLDRRFNIKLADFGFARNAEGNNYDYFLRSWRGTEGYIAPQIHKLLYKGEQVDMFAAGVVLFLMFVRIPPFQNTEISNQKYNMIREGKLQLFWSKFQRKMQPFPAAFKDLIEGMFVTDPEKRLTAEQVLNHPWLKGTILSNEELNAYLKPRYEKLMTRDQETRTIRRNLRDNLERMVNENEMERERTRENRPGQEVGIRVAEALTTAEAILHFNIKGQNIRQTQEYGLRYAKATPKTILLWVNHFLSTLKEQKKSVFKDSLEQILLSDFQLKYNEQGQINATIILDITSEEDSFTTDIKLQGQLLSWKDQISISWRGVQGHQFWLYELIQTLNDQFQLTFL